MTEHSIDLVANLVRSHKRNSRRVYNIGAKRELVRRCLEPGVSLAATAMAHGINANLVRKWVAMQAGQRISAARTPTTMPAKLLSVTAVATRTRALPITMQSEIELVVPGGTIRLRGPVAAEALRTVLDCLSARS